MKWFRHMTDSWTDEKLSTVTSEHGLEIYGFWWRLLEIVGKQMNGGDRSSCQYPLPVWGKFSGISAKKFQKFAGILAEKKIIILKNVENEVCISVPNIVKYRDEWTKRKRRNSGVAPE